MAEIGTHLLGRKPSPPDLRDYRLANFQGIGETEQIYDPNTEIALAVKELQLTTVSYPRWAATHYADVTKTHWWQAFNHLANASGNTPPTPVLDKVWDASFQLDQGATGHCFPAGTLIRMGDGSHKRIEDVRVFDHVLTAEGRVRQVTQTMGRFFEGDLVGVRARGLGTGLTCTPEHPFLTTRGYIRADSLRMSDHLATPFRMGDDHPALLDVASLVGERVFKRAAAQGISVRRHHGVAGRAETETIVSPLPESIELTPEFGRLLGLYLAEGTLGGSYTGFCFGLHEADTLVAETVELLQSVLGVHGRIQWRRQNNVAVVKIGGVHWGKFFSAVAGIGANGKRLLPEVAAGTSAYRDAVLHGWLDGDGYDRRGTRVGVTVSKQLALDMFAIARDLGYRAALRPAEPRDRQKAYYLEVGEDKQGAQDFRKLTDLTRHAFAGRVYNIEVEDDHSYVAEGFGVHNCVGFGWAGWGDTLPVDDQWVNSDGHAIYYECKVIEGDPGGEDGAYTRDGAKVMLNRHRLSTYAFADTMTTILEHLRLKGPVVIGSDWTDDMFSPDENGYVQPTGPVVGGHCYLLYGIEGNTLVFKNSWGDSWGDNGSFRMHISDFQPLLDAYGEAVASVELPL